MPRGSSSPCTLRSMSGLGGAFEIPAAIVQDFDFKTVVMGREGHADGEILVQLVSMLDGIDAGLRNGGLQVFDAIVRKPHQLRHAGRRAHGDLLVPHAGRYAELNRFAHSS